VRKNVDFLNRKMKNSLCEEKIREGKAEALGSRPFSKIIKLLR
jgi:hypothetical protein